MGTPGLKYIISSCWQQFQKRKCGKQFTILLTIKTNVSFQVIQLGIERIDSWYQRFEFDQFTAEQFVVWWLDVKQTFIRF